MRIHSLSQVLAMPILVTTVGVAYYQYVNDQDIGYWVIFPIVALVVLYISYGYIDYWFHTKYPVPLDKEILGWLRTYDTFYIGLSTEDKAKYEYRMSLYLEARSFMSVGSEQKPMPEDIKAIIATSAIKMNFNKKDLLIGDFDRVFIYKHPFPSPTHQFLHSVETNGEDGVIIYSLEHLIPGITNPESYYNIGMHAYVEAFTMVYTKADYPQKLEVGWDEVVAISGLTQKKILSTLGFDQADLFVVLATCFFTYPSRFEALLPALSGKMKLLFSD